jgi:hypothetical protein
MNVFMIANNHTERAKQYRDDHVNKILTETVQLMNNALHIHGRDDLAFYKPSHMNHPWSKWAASCSLNWMFLDNHAEALGQEYLYRSKYSDEQQTADRKREELWDSDAREEIFSELPDGQMSTMPVCTGDYEPDGNMILQKYRDYYANVKCGGERAVWTDRPRPDWIDEYR